MTSLETLQTLYKELRGTEAGVIEARAYKDFAKSALSSFSQVCNSNHKEILEAKKVISAADEILNKTDPKKKLGEKIKTEPISTTPISTTKVKSFPAENKEKTSEIMDGTDAVFTAGGATLGATGGVAGAAIGAGTGYLISKAGKALDILD